MALWYILAKPSVNYYLLDNVDFSGGVMASKLDEQNFTSELESQWVPYSYGFALHLSRKLDKLLPTW